MEESTTNPLEEARQRQIKKDQIARIVKTRIKEEWQQAGVPIDQKVIDQELETAARDLIEIANGGKRDKVHNIYLGEYFGADLRWYIPNPLTYQQYRDHRYDTDSNGAELCAWPKVYFLAEGDRWAVDIDIKDVSKLPAKQKDGSVLAQLFHDCGFPLTAPTRQTYLPSSTPLPSIK